MTGLHDGYKLYSIIYKSISVGSWKLDIKLWKEVKNWDREGLGWRCKGGLGGWAGSVGKSGRGGLYLDWFILERGHFTALGNSNEGKTLIFINIYSWWSEQEMMLQGLNLRGAEEPHLPWSHWETQVCSTLLGQTQTMQMQARHSTPQTLNCFDPAVLSHWRWCEFRPSERSAPKLHFHSWNWTRFQPLLARIHPKRLIPCSAKRQSFGGRVHHSELIFKAVLKVPPPFFVCDAAMFVRERFTISLLLLWNHPTFKLSRLNKPEPITSMSDHKVDDV